MSDRREMPGPSIATVPRLSVGCSASSDIASDFYVEATRWLNGGHGEDQFGTLQALDLWRKEAGLGTSRLTMQLTLG